MHSHASSKNAMTNNKQNYLSYIQIAGKDLVPKQTLQIQEDTEAAWIYAY